MKRMQNDHDKYQNMPGKGLMNQTAYELRRDFLGQIMEDADIVDPDKIKLEHVQNNIESFIGSIEMPLALAGPLHIDLKQGDSISSVFATIATTEGALVASAARGAKAVSQSGGVRARVLQQRMIRTPMFAFADMDQALQFAAWINKNAENIKKITPNYSNHARLFEINPIIIGKIVHLKFVFSTDDASGQNMTTACTWHSILWAEEKFSTETGIDIEYFLIDGNGSSDKKVSHYALQNGRGTSVIAECELSDDIIEKTLRTTSADMFRAYNHSMAISRFDGMVGYNINASNIIAGIFAATGQDLGSVHESSMAVLQMEKLDSGLYVSISLPCLVIGTVGGGTHLPQQKAILKMMGCQGPGKLERFAQIIAGYVLSLELSTLAAIASGQFARAHQKLGRNKPKNWLLASEIDTCFVNKNFASFADNNAETVKLKDSVSMDNGILSDLTKRVTRKLIGLFPIEMNLADGSRLSALLKSKPLDSDLMKGLHFMASCVDGPLADLLLEYQNTLEYCDSHLKEIETYEYLKSIEWPFIPGCYGSYIDADREIYLLLIEDLSVNQEIIRDTENNPDLWTDDIILTAIKSIHSVHKAYYCGERTIANIKEFKPVDNLGLYSKFNAINRKDYAHLNIDYIFEDMQSIIDAWACAAPVKLSAGTLVHNDYNPRNIAINGDSVIVYDWELATIDIPHRDIFELLAFVLPNDFDLSRLTMLLDSYYDLAIEINGDEYSYYDYLEDLLVAGYEFLISRASFYLAGSTLVNYSFITRVLVSAYKIIQAIKDMHGRA